MIRIQFGLFSYRTLHFNGYDLYKNSLRGMLLQGMEERVRGVASRQHASMVQGPR